MANFDYLAAVDAVEDNAFALQSSWKWENYKPTDNAGIPSFRAYLSSSSIEKIQYQSKFEQ